MKKLIACVFALSLCGATAASADVVGVGLHIGGAGVHLGVGHHHHYRHYRHYRHHYYRHHYRHCYWHHHRRHCR